MNLYELFQSDIEEVSMSPSALSDFAKTPFAQSVTAGFEAELSIPDISDEDGDLELDWDMDERSRSFDQIEEFFLNGDFSDGPRAVDRMMEHLREEFEECNKDLEVALYNLGFELDYAYEALKYVKI